MFAPDICIPALRTMLLDYGKKIYGRYGFVDAFNPTTGWVSKYVIGIDVGDGAPQFLGLAIGLEPFGRIAHENRCVQARFVELPDVGEQFPGPFDGFALEVVAEGPVAEHLEKGVVIGVLADIVEIVVLAAGADALLAVGRPVVFAFFSAEEDRLELIHAGVGKQERGIVEGDDGAAGHEAVAVLLDEEVDELLADLL